jgi:hypothetical protein
VYRLCVNVYWLLPPVGYPTAVNKIYIIYHIIYNENIIICEQHEDQEKKDYRCTADETRLFKGQMLGTDVTVSAGKQAYRARAFDLCDCRAAQTKRTVVYGSARTSDCWVVAMETSQRVPFQGRNDCRLTTACTNETQRNTVGYARTNVIGFRTSFIVASVRSSIH